MADIRDLGKDSQDAYDRAVTARMGSRFGRKTAGSGESDEAAEMRRNRQVMKRTANANLRGGSDMSFATGRPRDPLFYWKQNNLPYDLYNHQELIKVRAYCRLLYQSHPLIGSCIDIYTKYPLLGLELSCKDEQLTDFYSDLFGIGDEPSPDSLNYNKFLIDFGREYWTVGEAMPFGSFNESLGVWDDDELLNPDDIEVVRSPFSKDPRFFMKLPQTLRDIITTREPAWEYRQLMQAYPELAHYTAEDAHMPVSSILLRQHKFEADTFNKRGVPLLMRAMRPIMQEEMLNAAMDAVADRLYTPLILARLGASASDLGTSIPWIPTQDELADFEEALDSALAADFRVLIHHFGVQMEPVFGREAMPDMTPDFERLEDRILQTFGLSKTMLTGASSGQTYAADALNRDLVSQLLTTYQTLVKGHYRQRATVVAEAQEHYDYDERNGKRYVKMEEILVVDEESGEERIIEQPKLLIPQMHMKCLALDTPVQTPTGPVANQDLREGDEVLAWDEVNNRMTTALVEASVDNGVQPTYEIRTRTGRVIRATEEHPFLTADGWQKAMHLAPGARLRTAEGYANEDGISVDEARFLGLMIGDGGMTGNDVRISAADVETVAWVRQYVERTYGCVMTHVGQGVDYRLCQTTRTGPGRNPNPIKARLGELGLWGHAGPSKRVPAAVWAADPQAQAAFLSGYLDADGTVWSGQSRKIEWTSASEHLLRDCQTLLSYLGIRASVRAVKGRNAWTLTISSKGGIRAAWEHLSPMIVRKRAFLTWILGTHRESLSPEYDEVVSVTLCEPEPTWSLTIQGYHTHVTAGLVTHNTMNIKDEEAQREFFEQLRAAGIPISMKTRLQNIPFSLDDEIERSKDEQVMLAVAEQETRREMFKALRDGGHPISQALRDDFEPKAAQTDTGTGVGQRIPMFGTDPLNDTPNLAPTAGDLALPVDGTVMPGMPVTPVQPFDPNAQQQALGAGGDIGDRPDESDEMRADMPKAAKTTPVDQYRAASRMRQITAQHYEAPPEPTMRKVAHAEGDDADFEPDPEPVEDGIPRGKFAAPKHIGMRAHAGLSSHHNRDTFELDEQDAARED